MFAVSFDFMDNKDGFHGFTTLLFTFVCVAALISIIYFLFGKKSIASSDIGRLHIINLISCIFFVISPIAVALTLVNAQHGSGAQVFCYVICWITLFVHAFMIIAFYVFKHQVFALWSTTRIVSNTISLPPGLVRFSNDHHPRSSSLPGVFGLLVI